MRAVNESYMFITVTVWSTEPVRRDPKSATFRKPPSHVFPLLKGTKLSALDHGRTIKHSAFIVLFIFFIEAARSAELLQLQRGTVLLTCYYWTCQLL